MINISSSFDAGNIEVVSLFEPQDIQLKIRKDTAADFFQWFYFRIQGAINQPLTLRFLNAAKASYIDGWEGYQAVASYDRKTWFRVPSRYENGELIVDITPEYNSVYLAYFAPYSYERHLDLIAKSELSEYCRSDYLGSSVEGRDMTLLTVGDVSNAHKKIWIIGRQHPGETMAEWFIEGLLESLLDASDALSKQLLQQAVFYIVPNMNPDGSVLGNLRTNACGANLNREWAVPSLKKSPEVFHVQQMMKNIGCDLFLDIHGDEGLPYNFIVGQHGESVHQHILDLENIFQHFFVEANPDFQMTHGYPIDQFGDETATVASHWVGNYFQCPSMTVEMPFKDNANLPDQQFGWSPERSRLLGQSILRPIDRLLPQLN